MSYICYSVTKLAVMLDAVADFPGFIGKVLHNLLKCLIAFHRMRNIPVRKTDFNVSI